MATLSRAKNFLPMARIIVLFIYRDVPENLPPKLIKKI